jgi:hypothetical protein
MKLSITYGVYYRFEINYMFLHKFETNSMLLSLVLLEKCRDHRVYLCF